MPRILVSTSSFNVPPNGALEALYKAGCEVVLNPHGRRLTEAESIAILREGVVGMVAGTEPLTRAVLTEAPDLKVISRCGIGLDNVDLAAASALGIDVLNTPDAPSAAVAELTLGLMLSALRRIAESDRALRAGQWRPLMGRLLAHRTVGVLGYGRVGRKVAALTAAFGARVLAYDVVPIESKAGIESAMLDELLAASDIVTLHLPASTESRHLINERTLGQMKTGSILVNASRGSLVDEAALFQALSSGRLASAALDTYEREPYSGPLSGLPQVVLTAHMGSAAEEARAHMEEEAVRNLLDALGRHGLLGTPAAVSAAGGA